MKKSIRSTLAIVAGSLLGLAVQSAWADDTGVFSLTSGLDYSSGKYGTNERTEITSVPLIGKYEQGNWVLKLTVPYVSITGPGNVSPGIGVFRNSTNTKRTTESGLGDIVAAATYNVYSGGQGGPAVDLTGKVKFGTADENKGLGTGKNDYMGQVDVYQSFGDFTALGTVGYRVYGDTSAAPLDNVFYGSIGGTYKIMQGTSTGIIYDYRSSITSNGSGISEVTAFVNHKINDNWKAQAYLVKGLADGSPDYGVGALVGYVF